MFDVREDMNEKLPLVTIVTPSYNHGHFIEETIQSVLSQDYPHIEYIVVDGGSADNTVEILRRYDGRLIWVSEPDRGQSHAINKGFHMAQGEILAWINADDKYEPGAVGKSVRYLVDNPGIAMTYGRVNVISADGELIETTQSPRPFDLWAITYMTYGIDQASTFFRKNALASVGYVNEGLNWCMDWDLWVRIGSRFKIGTLDTVIASIRLYYGNKTSTGGLKRIAEIISLIRNAPNASLFFGIFRASMGMLHMYLKYRHPFLYRYLQGSVIFFKQNILNKLYANFQGVYSDGWLGRKAHFLFPLNDAAIELAFTLDFPDDPRLVPNRITIMVDTRQVLQLQILSYGPYELRFPCSIPVTKPFEVLITFSRSLPPDGDGRRLACRLVNPPDVCVASKDL